MIDQIHNQNYLLEEISNLRHSQTDVIEGILNYLSSKLIRNEKINEYINFLQNSNSGSLYFNYSKSYTQARTKFENCNYGNTNNENNLKFEIINVIEDFNNIVNQCLQAVRTLQFENLNLKVYEPI